jgi:hypothetical protein
MNCFRPLKHWDHGIESHLRNGGLCAFMLFILSCVQKAALRRADPPFKESYLLCKISRNWDSDQGPKQRACRAINREIGSWIIHHFQKLFLKFLCRSPQPTSVNLDSQLCFKSKPVLNGISRVQNNFTLKPGFRLIKIYYECHRTWKCIPSKTDFTAQ